MARHTTEETSSEIKNPILIVDKEGVIGKELILKLGKDIQVVFCTRGNHYFPSDFARSVVHVPFIKKFPTIPDGDYSTLFIIDNRFSHVRQLISSFVEKAEKDKIPVLYATPLTQIDENQLLEIKQKYPKLKILIYGEVFDKNLSLDQDALVNRFLYDTFAYGKIEVAGNGLIRTYPVYLDDVVLGILEVIFGTHSGNQVFLAFPRHAFTALALARAIKRAKPDVKIDLVGKEEIDKKPLPPSGLYLLDDNYPLDERIRRVVMEVPSKPLGSRNLESVRQKREFISPSRGFPFRSFVVSFIFFLLLPLIVTFSSAFLGVLSLYQVQGSLVKGNIADAQVWAGTANNFLSLSQATYQPLYLEASLLGLGPMLSPVGVNINAGKDISKSALSLASAYKKMSAVFSGKSTDPSKDFSDANLQLWDALVLLRKLEGDKDVDKRLIAIIKENDKLLSFASSVQTVLPQIIGVDGGRNYLVLFQNNMELRPTGGFIGSYGLLALKNGKIDSFTVSDVYDADGQLKGHVEPPFPIRRYLPSVHWYLRDSGFNLDFPKAASASAFFLKIATGKTVDGVIAIDVSFMQKILKIMGGVKVPEYNETVTADNFFKLAVEHSEKNFFPGSTQKKDFLGAVFRAMQSNLAQKKDISYLAFAKAIEESILSKHILLSSPDPSIAGLFTVNNWSSSLWDSRKNQDSAVDDFLYINEANLGINKVNFFIERKVSKNTIINDEGKVLSELKITYKNKSTGSWPGGSYKNYLRIVVPKGALLSQIVIDGKVQKTTNAITDPLIYEDKKFVPPAELEVEKTEEDGKQVYGILLNIPAGSTRSIIFGYALAEQINLASVSSVYSLKFVKQPGVVSIPLDFSLSYPSSQRVVSMSGGLLRQSGSVSFKKDLFSDEDINIKLAKTE